MKPSIVAAFLMCDGSEFKTDGPKHWSEEIEKESTDAEGQRDKQGWRW